MVRKERRRETPNPMIQKVRELGGGHCSVRGASVVACHAQAGRRVGAFCPSYLLSSCPSDQEIHKGEARIRAEQQ